MAKDLILKSTSVDDKRPTPSQLDIGEISLGYNEAGAFLCCKDSAGNIQQVGGIKFSEDAPGTPVKGTLWLKPSTFILYGYDGQFWLPIASGGGGGGSSAVSEIVAGDGIDVTPTPGIGVVTLNVDFDQTKGLEILAGRLVVAIGEGLAFDPSTGKINATAGGLAYKGEVDLTTSAARPTNPLSGDLYLNNGTGNSNAVWNPDIATNTSVNVSDIIVYNGASWDLFETSSVTPNPILWSRSAGVTSPFNAADDIEIGSGAIELNSSGSAQFTGPVVYQNTSAPGGTTAIQVKDGSSTVYRVSANGETETTNTASFGSAGNTKLYANGAADIDGNLVIGQSTTLRSNGKGEFSNDVLVGGTLPSAPNITLKANGLVGWGDDGYLTVNQNSTLSIGAHPSSFPSRSWGGFISLTGRDKNQINAGTDNRSVIIDGGRRTSGRSDGNIWFDRGVSSNTATPQAMFEGSTGNFYLGGTLPNSPNIELKSDGSADFKGEVQINGTSGSSNRLRITQTGSNAADQSNIRLTTPASDYILYSTGSDNRLSIFDANANDNRLMLDGSGNVGIGGTLPSAPNIELKNDGSADFAGTVNVRDTLISKGITNGAIVFAGRNTSAQNTSLIFEDGSAEFDGSVTSGGNPSSGAAEGARMTSAGIIRAARTNSASSVWLAYTVGNSTETSKIDASGNAEFSGDITIGGNAEFSGDLTIGDKIQHLGDTNTAIRFPANDAVSIETNGNEVVRVDLNGHVGLGTDNPQSRLHLSSASSSDLRLTNTGSAGPLIYGDGNRDNENQLLLGLKALWDGTEVSSINFVSGTDTANKDNGSITFRTNDGSGVTAKAQFEENGTFNVRSDNALQAQLGTFGDGTYRNGENYMRIFAGSSTDYLQLRGCNNADNSTVITSVIGGTNRVNVQADGDIFNINGTYGQISDEKLKENIEDASSQWDDVKATKVRSFNFKEGTGYSTHKQIGWVAQEVELVSPGCVSESKPEAEGEEPTKVLKSSVMLIKAYKALQEAMERIEVLEQRLDELTAS